MGLGFPSLSLQWQTSYQCLVGEVLAYASVCQLLGSLNHNPLSVQLPFLISTPPPHYFPKLYVLVFSQDAAQHQCPSLTRCFSRNLLSWENGTGQRSELRIREGWAEWAVTGHSSLSKRKQRKGRPGAARRARGSGSDLTLERFKFECVRCLSFLPLLPAWHNHRRV